MESFDRINMEYIIARLLSLTAKRNPVRKTVKLSSDLSYEVIYHNGVSGKKPLLIFSHNGGGNSGEWGDYPALMARRGYLSVVMQWSDFYRRDDVTDVLVSLNGEFRDVTDFDNVVLLGGCHGGVKNNAVVNGNNFDILSRNSVRGIVYISLSEKITLKEPHPPLLVIYTDKDRLGKQYQDIDREIAEKTLSEPKEIALFHETPHGSELISDSKSSEKVRRIITSWIENLFKLK